MNERTPPAERLFRHLRVNLLNGCIEWCGARHMDGYGYIGSGGNYDPNGHRAKNILTHRLAFEVAFGSIPKNKQVNHSCDNRKCCNPHHLWLGTQAENNHDMKKKGRARSGKKRLLKDDAVVEIRKLISEGKLNLNQIAVMFLVDRSIIKNIVLGKTYASVA